MDFLQAFETIKKIVKALDCEAFTQSFAIQFNITDPDCGGAFYAEYHDGELRLEPYDYRDHTCEVTADFEKTKKLFEQKLSPEDALNVGVSVNGDTNCFIMFFGGLKKKSTAAKKTATKASKKPATKTTNKAASSEKKTTTKKKASTTSSTKKTDKANK